MARLVLLGATAVLLAGCRQDMHDQPKYEPLEKSQFFADHQASRQPPDGTVARGELRADKYLYTGMSGNQAGDQFPMPVTLNTLKRGQERFNIYCAPCHSRTGDGDGMIVQRGYRRPPSFHDVRLRTAPAGHFFDVMTNGFGAMPSYAAQVPVMDRWAIAAYVRALQMSHQANINDVPESERGNMAAQPAGAAVRGQEGLHGVSGTTQPGETEVKPKTEEPRTPDPQRKPQ